MPDLTAIHSAEPIILKGKATQALREYKDALNGYRHFWQTADDLGSIPDDEAIKAVNNNLRTARERLLMAINGEIFSERF